MAADPTQLDLAAWLTARDALLPWAGTTRLKRLGDAGEAGYRTDVELRVDRGRMRIGGVCTSESLDRSREVVRAKGLDVSDHRTNPILTVGHRWREPEGQVGRCEVDGKYTVRPGAESGSTPFIGQFFQKGPNAEIASQTFELIDTGVLRGVSIGFIIPPGGAVKSTHDDGHPYLDIIRSKLFEVTTLPVGDNPDAVVRVVEKGLGGRKLLPVLEAMLRPLVPPKRATVRGGYTREKVMDPYGNGAAAAAPMAQPQPQADPTMGMAQPVPPSAQFLSDLNTYLIGLLKFSQQAQQTQESPLIEPLLPQLQQFISQAFRATANTYAQLQAKYPDIPTLPGAGSLLAAEAPPPGAEGDAANPEGGGGPVPLDFGDDFDEGADFGDGDPPPADEDEPDDDEKTKALKARRRARYKAMRARSEKMLNDYWSQWQAEIDASDATRFKALDELIAGLLASAAVPAPLRKAARDLRPYVREKALDTARQARELGAAGVLDLPTTDVLAEAVRARLGAELRPIRDALYQATGRGAD